MEPPKRFAVLLWVITCLLSGSLIGILVATENFFEFYFWGYIAGIIYLTLPLGYLIISYMRNSQKLNQSHNSQTKNELKSVYIFLTLPTIGSTIAYGILIGAVNPLRLNFYFLYFSNILIFCSVALMLTLAIFFTYFGVRAWKIKAESGFKLKKKNILAFVLLAGVICSNYLLFFGKYSTRYQITSIDHFTEVGTVDPSEPIIPRGVGNDTDLYIREIGNVLYDPIDPLYPYKILYTGYTHGTNSPTRDTKLHFAYSQDGIHWEKYKHNPLIIYPAEDPYVVKVNNTYYLFFEDKLLEPANKIRRYHSTDFINWTDDGPIFPPNEDKMAWDSSDVSSPVVFIDNSFWYLIYEGRGAGSANGIGLAVSSDGGLLDPWKRASSDPIFDRYMTRYHWVDSDEDVVPDDLEKIGEKFYLTYHGFNGKKWFGGMAISENLTNWIDYQHNPFSDAYMNRASDFDLSIEGNQILFYYYFSDYSGIYRGVPLKNMYWDLAINDFGQFNAVILMIPPILFKKIQI